MYEDIMRKATQRACVYYAIKQNIIIVLKLFCIYVIIIYGSSLIMPDRYYTFLNEKRTLIIIVIGILSLIQAIREYLWLKVRLDKKDFIRKLISQKSNGLVELNQIIYEYESRIDLLKVQIEYLKFFSVIPFFTYWMGRYIESKKELEDIINTNIYNITLVDGFLYLSIIALLVYITIFLKKLKRYEFFNENLIDFGKAKIECIAYLENNERQLK